MPTLVYDSVHLSILEDGWRRWRWNFWSSFISEQFELSGVTAVLVAPEWPHPRDGSGVDKCSVSPETHKAPVVRDRAKMSATKTHADSFATILSKKPCRFVAPWIVYKMLSFEFFSCQYIHKKLAAPPQKKSDPFSKIEEASVHSCYMAGSMMSWFFLLCKFYT